MQGSYSVEETINHLSFKHIVSTGLVFNSEQLEANNPEKIVTLFLVKWISVQNQNYFLK